MCFYTGDCEWTADVQEESTRTIEKPLTCHECYRKMPVGSTMHHIFQQEHEWCYACIGGCQCEKPQLGETYDYDRCEDCHKMLLAIHDAEIAAGCPEHEAQPYLGQMIEAINDGGMDEARKYWKQAAKQFPELRGYLGWLWRKTFHLADRAA